MSVLLVFVWTAAEIHYAFGGNWTAAFRTGPIFRIPPDLDAPVISSLSTTTLP
jgi:hypothetical protein